jgi:hypothetical protein
MTSAQKHRFIPLDEPIDPVVARPVLSIPDQILRYLSILAAQLNISARAATSQPMTEFIAAVIASTWRDLFLIDLFLIGAGGISS